MKTRVLSVLTLALVLFALTAGTVLADSHGPTEPVVMWDDTQADRTMPERGGGGSYVRNGAFDEWMADGPKYWELDMSGLTGKGHFAQVDLATPNSSAPNYALGTFLRNDGADAAGSLVAYTDLNVPASGNYWVSVHSTAWGHRVGGGDAVSWYAIAETHDPAAVPDSAWRELSPMWTGPCPNGNEVCMYLGREETRYIESGSYLLLKSAIKYPTMHGWAAFAWDDIGVWDMDPAAEWPYVDEDGEPVFGWLDSGEVTWDQHAIR